MNKGARFIIFASIAVILLLLILPSMGKSGSIPLLSGQQTVELNISDFEKRLSNEEIKTADWQVSTISGEMTDGRRYQVQAYAPESEIGAKLKEKIDGAGVTLDIKKTPTWQAALPLFLMGVLPILILVGAFFFFMRSAQAGGNQAMSFGRSKARRAGEMTPKVTFDDVAGIDEAKEELFEIVDFLKNTKKYVALGAKIPKGILLTGPPGVGKTHLARAIAGEAGVPFFHISGSDFVEMFVGVGAARVRDLFETAKAHKPCLVFMDEIDAVGRQRGAGLGGGHDEREQTLNQLLVEMDGFDANTGVIMIAATNRPDVLDPALLRPGRFDRRIVVDPPDVSGRKKILDIHSKGKPIDPTVDMGVIAKRTPGFTGADLANSLNEAALLAARRNKSRIEMEDIEESLDRVMAGPQRKSRVMDSEERRIIAYHEAGHAIVGELLEHADPVHKITVLPRGMSLGSTWSLPDKDTYLVSENELVDDIVQLLGGRVAEELVFSQVTTGAANDLQRVARIARAMVTEYGMSSKLGTLAIGRNHRNPFLGRDYAEERDYSEDVARMIDEEVRAIVETCRQRAETILTENREKLDKVSEALLERETLDREEFLALLAGKELPPVRKEEQSGTPTAADKHKSDKKDSPATPNTRLEPGTA